MLLPGALNSGRRPLGGRVRRAIFSSVLGLAVICSSLDAGQWPWTIEELLHLPTLSDPQIRPDGNAFTYVRRDLDDSYNRYRNTILLPQTPTCATAPIAEAN